MWWEAKRFVEGFPHPTYFASHSAIVHLHLADTNYEEQMPIIKNVHIGQSLMFSVNNFIHLFHL